MIPEFITAKPATNRNASETPSVGRENSADQLRNKDAFQKALQEQSANRQAERQSSRLDDRLQIPAEDETRSEPPSRPAREKASTDTDRGRSVQEPSRDAANHPRPGGNDATEPNATDGVRTDNASGTDQAATGEANEPQSRESSKLIRRIDLANHSDSDIAAASPAGEQVGDELASQTLDTALPRFLSTDDLDSVTLPSLIRRPLNEVSISQLPDDLLAQNPSAVDGDLRQVPTGLVPSVADGELPPFQDDALIPAAELAESRARFTATDPFLIGDDFQSSSSANVNVSIAGEDLLSIPTLPSLRPEAPSPSPPTASQNSTKPDRSTSGVVGRLVDEGLAGVGPVVSEVASSDVATVGENSSLISVQIESEPPLPSDETDSKVDAPVQLPTETEQGVFRSVVGNTSRSSVSAIATVESDVDHPAALSQDSFVASSIVSAVDGGVTEATLRAAVTGSEEVRPEPDPTSRTAVKPGTNQSSGNLELESPAIQQPSVEVNNVDRHLPTDVGSSQPAQSADSVDVGIVPVAGALLDEGAAPIRNDAVEVIIDPASKRNLATAVGAIEPGERQSRSGAEAADVSSNSVVAEPVQLGSPANTEPGRLTTRDSEGSRQELPLDGDDILPSDQAARQRNRARASSNQRRPPVTQEGTVTNPVETSAKVGSEQPSSDGLVTPPRDQRRASERDSRLSPTADESPLAESRNSNSVDFTPVDSPATSSAVQSSQQVSSVPNPQGPVSDTTKDVSVASSTAIQEVGDVSASRVPTEVRSIDTPLVSSIQSPNASPTSAAPARSDVVREPAIPIEIQEAVSAIQEATSGDSHIRVRLNPRELGNMLVDVSRTESGVVARLEVESAAARAAVLETLPDLQRSLARSGTSVDRVEVVFTENRAESGRQDADQSQQRDQQQSRQDRQSSDQRQARDGQNQRREQNERREQRERPETSTGGDTDPDTSGQLDIKL